MSQRPDAVGALGGERTNVPFTRLSVNHYPSPGAFHDVPGVGQSHANAFRFLYRSPGDKAKKGLVNKEGTWPRPP